MPHFTKIQTSSGEIVTGEDSGTNHGIHVKEISPPMVSAFGELLKRFVLNRLPFIMQAEGGKLIPMITLA